MRAPAAFLSVLLSGVFLIPQPELPGKPVSFAILEDYDKGEELGEVARDFALFKELEIDVWRGSFGWDDYEPERGTLDLEWLHRFATLAREHQLKLRPYLAYTPAWAGAGGRDSDAWNDAPQWLADWTRFAGGLAAALRRHPHVLSFEIYNEQNVPQWWDSTSARYADVVTSGSRAIQGANPHVQVLFGGLVFPDAAWVEQVCSAPGARNFDVLPFHAYPETWTPSDVTVENYLRGLEEFIAIADQTCGRKAIWINETGFATTPGRTEQQQAAWWVRAVATFLAHPRVEHLGVYEIKDLAPDKPAIGDAPNYHLGLTRADRSKKLAFYTVDMLTDLLDTGTLTVADTRLRLTVLEGSAGVYRHMFIRPDGDRVIIAWTKSAPVRARFEAGRATKILEYRLDGSSAPLPELGDVALSPGTPRIFRLVRD